MLTVADADGTPLAVAQLSAHHTDTPVLFSALAIPEHGAGRNIRVTTPLKDCPGLVLVDRAPSVSDVLDLGRPAVAGTVLLLVASSREAASHQYPQTLHELRAAAELVPGLTLAHVVIPEYCAVDPILQALGAPVLKDLRRNPANVPDSVSMAGAGTVLMFTGLSGSGKSTLARSVLQKLQQLSHRPVLLDGDDIRRFVSKGLGFSREDRETNVERIGWIGARIAEAGGIALCAPIAPFEATRQKVAHLAALAGARFLLVHVSTSLQVCEHRDRKGLYAQARAGQISDFTGIDSPYETPQAPDLRLDLGSLSLDQATDQVLALLLS
ncbi:adenylyl-sulfate kinase [Glutamicibacter mysorens]